MIKSIPSLSKKKSIIPYVTCIFFLFLQNGVSAQNFASKDQNTSAVKENYNTTYIDSLYAHASYLSRSNSDSALILGHKINDLSLKIKYKKGMAMSQEAIARAYVNSGEYEKGIKLAKETLNLAQEINAHEVYLNCINVLGFAHFLKQELHNVYNYNQIGLAYAKKTGNQDKIFTFSNNAGTLLARIGDFDKALEFYNSCFSLLKQSPDSTYMAQVLNNLGSMQYKLGKFKESRKNLEESIKISGPLKMTNWESDANITLANIALQNEDYQEAEIRLIRSEALLKNSQDQKQRIETDIGFAKLELKKEQLEKAALKASDALIKAKQSNYYIGILQTSEILYKITAQQAKMDDAYNYLLMHTHLKDSLNVANNENKVKIMMVEKNLKSKQEVVQLKMNQKITEKNIFIGIAIASLMVLGTIAFLIKRVSDTRKKLITQLNTKTEELEKNKNELTILNTTKDKLFSIIGHDLKGPISSLHGLLDLLVSGQVKTEEFLNFILNVTKDVDHLNFTLNNLLSWATSQLSGINAKPTNIDLSTLVNNNVRLFQSKSNEKLIQLNSKLEAGTLIWADGNQIDIVIRNLISNALKFTYANGSITITNKLEDGFQKVSVYDTGVGIKKETLSTLFSNSTVKSTYGTKNEKGTGLGLSICKEMVENNGGTIWVKSEVNKGTIIQFTVPIPKS